MCQRILVATDGSVPAARALDEAIKLAREQQAKLRIVHVVGEGLVVSPDVPSANLSETQASLRADGELLLEAASSKARSAGVDTDTVLLEQITSRPGPGVIEQAKEWRADLIVCGTHWRRGIQRLVLGSDSEYVVRQASVPVLLLRSPAP